MTFTTADTVRERARRLLAATTEPLTTADIANQLGTTPHQAQRALRQLEQQGAAVRQHGGRPSGGWTPDWWTASG